MGSNLQLKSVDAGKSCVRAVPEINAARATNQDIVWQMRHDTLSFDCFTLLNDYVIARKKQNGGFFVRLAEMY